MTVQLSTTYTYPECHNILCHRQTDKQTTVSCQQLILLCAAVQSANKRSVQGQTEFIKHTCSQMAK